MTYKEYKEALANIDKNYKCEKKRQMDMFDDINRRLDAKEISEKEAFELMIKVNAIIDSSKNRNARSIDNLKTTFANQDTSIKVGDIIWAKVKGSTKVLRVEAIRLAAFEYPMLKLFGTQLTLYGQPCQKQTERPKGGIYQKDITSINGEPYTYKTR